jgi:hypothetical protein
MNRMFRLHLVLVIAIVLALASVPFASAKPLGTSPSIERTVGGWMGAAVRWLEDVAGLQRSISNRAAAAPAAHQKDGGNHSPGGGHTPLGGSCLDPTGKPWCL